MSRVLLAWELGSAFGHLSTLLQLATCLRRRGHQVLVAARDLVLATETLAPAGIRFVQSPTYLRTQVSEVTQQSFADIILTHGWDSTSTLWGLVQAWGSLFSLFNPDCIVINYAPTALLSAKILKRRMAVIGTGFEMPPLENPLRPFTRHDHAAFAQARLADDRAMAHANHVCRAYKAEPLEALRDVFNVGQRWLTTFPELDPYGVRAHETYVGPVGNLDRGAVVDWPENFRYRILAYLRPGMPNLFNILTALSDQQNSAVICVAPGVSDEVSRRLARPGFVLTPRPVAFKPLLVRADAFVSYAPAASVAQALLASVPELMAPLHVEAALTAARVSSLGSGLTLRGNETAEEVAKALWRVVEDARLKDSAKAFSDRHSRFDAKISCEMIADAISLPVIE